MVAAESRKEAARVAKWAVERSECRWNWVDPERCARVTRAWLLKLDQVEIAACVLAGAYCLAQHLAGERFPGLPLRDEKDIDGFRQQHQEERTAVSREWRIYAERRRLAQAAERESRSAGGGPRYRGPK